MFGLDNFVYWIGNKMKEAADEELYGSKEKLHQQLFDLQAKVDRGDMSEADYLERETEILGRLQEMEERAEEERNDHDDA